MSLPLSVLEGKYEILSKIHEGGMGAIYRVRHRELDEVRVVKVVLPKYEDKSKAQQRFRREARAAVRLRHPNIAQLFDYEVDPQTGNGFMVQEFIAGVNLRQMLDLDGVPDLSLALEIARQGLEAVGYLHERNFVHRDIAPDNLMLTQDHRKEPLIKLIDLGIVKHLGGETLSNRNDFLGKVRYASPEQFGDPRGIDARSDLYSFGVLLYQLLTGEFPLQGENFVTLAAAHLNREPVPFDEVDKEGRVSQGVRECVMKALAKKPADRMSSAQEFIDMLPDYRGDTLVETTERAITASLTVVPPMGSAGSLSTGGRAILNPDVFPVGRTPVPEGSWPGPRAVERPQDVDTLMAAAQTARDRGQLEECLQVLYRILLAVPRHRPAVTMRNEVEVAMEEDGEAAKARAGEIADRARGVEEAISAGLIEEASARLEEARVDLGEATRFVELDGVLLEVRKEVELQQRERTIAEAVDDVGEALRVEDLELARGGLQAAREVLGEDPRFEALDTAVAELEAAVEKRAILRARLDALRFSVEHPTSVVAGEWLLLSVTSRYANDAPEMVGRVSETVEDLTDGSGSLVKAGLNDGLAAKGDVVTIAPEVALLEIEPSEIRFRVGGQPSRAQFRIRASPFLVGHHAEGAVTLRTGVRLLASADLGIDVVRQGASGGTTRVELPRLERVFASYAPEDKEAEDALALLARETDDDYLTNLMAVGRDGRGRAARKRLMEAADVCELFWSKRSLRSPEGAAEWQHALSLSREHFVRPVYWQLPRPTSDTPHLPPPALEALPWHCLVEGGDAQRRDAMESGVRDSILETEATAIDAALQTRDAETAALLLESLTARFGDAKAGDLPIRLDQLRKELAAQARDVLVHAAAAEIEELLDAGRLKEARGRLDSAVDQEGTHARLAELALRIREAIADQERAQAVTKAVSLIEASLGREDADEAEKLLGDGFARFGDEPALEERQVLLDALRARLAERAEAERIRLRIQELLSRATELARTSEFEGAIASLDAALEIEDRGSVRETRRSYVVSLESQQAGARRRREIEAVRSDVEVLLEDADFDAALARISSAVENLGNDTALGELGGLVKATRERAREEQDAAVEQAVVTVQAYIDARDIAAARMTLAAARESLGEEDRLDVLAVEIDAVDQEIEAAATRKARIQGLVAEAQRLAVKGGRETGSRIRSLPDPGNLEESIERLEAAVELDPTDRGLRKLLEEFQGELASRATARLIEDVRPRIKELLDTENADGAAEQLVALRRDAGEHATLDELEGEVAALRERLEERRRTAERAAKLEEQEALLLAAAEAAGQGDFEQAMLGARRAADVLPGDAEEARRLLGEYETAHALVVEKQRVQRDIDVACDKAESLIAAGGARRLRQARKALAAVAEHVGGSPRLAVVVRRCEAAEEARRTGAAGRPYSRRPLAWLGSLIVGGGIGLVGIMVIQSTYSGRPGDVAGLAVADEGRLLALATSGDEAGGPVAAPPVAIVEGPAEVVESVAVAELDPLLSPATFAATEAPVTSGTPIEQAATEAPFAAQVETATIDDQASLPEITTSAESLPVVDQVRGAEKLSAGPLVVPVGEPRLLVPLAIAAPPSTQLRLERRGVSVRIVVRAVVDGAGRVRSVEFIEEASTSVKDSDLTRSRYEALRRLAVDGVRAARFVPMEVGASGEEQRTTDLPVIFGAPSASDR